MKEYTFQLSGLHCRSCELLVEHEVKKIPGIDSVKISHKDGILRIHSSEPIDTKIIWEATKRAGYPISNTSVKGAKNIPHPETLIRDTIFGIAIAVLIWFFLPSVSKMFDPTGGISGSTGLILTALITGLAAGVSTCMALAGGLVMAVSAEANSSFRAQLLFHSGRLAAYTVWGFFLGLLGTAAKFSDIFVAILSGITGIVLFRLALSMTGLFPNLPALSIPLPEKFKRRFSHGEVAKTAPALVGALTFFLPCGFTLAIELAVMRAGDPLLGAISMATFVLGTTPGLLLLWLAAGWKGRWRTSFLRVVGWVIATFSLVTLSSAWNTFTLASISPTPTSPTVVISNSGSSEIAPKAKGSLSIVLTQDGRGYTPNTLRLPRNSHIELVVNSTNPYTCAADFTIPELGFHKFLDKGLNTFEFETPDEEKDIWFGCGMRMFQGKIEVR
jgi:sulfite exporter TauE/SafE/copper chaperone CopZ